MNVYQRIFESTPDALLLIDAGGRISRANAQVESIFGYLPGELIGQPVETLIPRRLAARHLEHCSRFLENPRSRPMGAASDLLGRRKDDTEFPVDIMLSPMGPDRECAVLCVVRDISGRKRTEEDLRVAATAFQAQVGILVTDPRGVILQVNRAFVDMAGYSPEEIVGRTPRVLRSGRHDDHFYALMLQSIERTGSWQGEIWNRRKSGQIFPVWLTITAVKGAEGVVTHYVGTQIDITETKAAEDEIRNLAFFDPLTHLPNRRLLLDRLTHALSHGNRRRRNGALLLIDLDNFKTLNDSLGHDKGDILLQQAAARILKCVRESDTVARLGGDEFVVILEDLARDPGEAATKAEHVAHKVLAALNEGYDLKGHEYHSTASVGVTLFGARDHALEEILKQADLAMYQAKAAGRNAVCFFDPKMQAAVAERMVLEADLHNAIRDGQFVLFYQAQVDGQRRVTGAEALLRWHHTKRGLVLPGEFLPLAEESGLIVPLGRWVLEAACAQLAAWGRRSATAHLALAVNISIQQVRQPNFVEVVQSVLERTGANPRKLKLELTESVLMSDVDDTICKMSDLKALGVSFALDDFGTGFSCLSYLKRLPLKELKIDRSFVKDILTDANDAAIAKTIVALAQSLGLAVIAEGVETEAQRACLEQNGCRSYQGYLLARPVPLEAFEYLLNTPEPIGGFEHLGAADRDGLAPRALS